MVVGKGGQTLRKMKGGITQQHLPLLWLLNENWPMGTLVTKTAKPSLKLSSLKNPKLSHRFCYKDSIRYFSLEMSADLSSKSHGVLFKVKVVSMKYSLKPIIWTLNQL